jgi:hypothetical protein
MAPKTIAAHVLRAAEPPCMRGQPDSRVIDFLPVDLVRRQVLSPWTLPERKTYATGWKAISAGAAFPAQVQAAPLANARADMAHIRSTAATRTAVYMTLRFTSPAM